MGTLILVIVACVVALWVALLVYERRIDRLRKEAVYNQLCHGERDAGGHYVGVDAWNLAAFLSRSGGVAGRLFAADAFRRTTNALTALLEEGRVQKGTVKGEHMTATLWWPTSPPA